ncbi:LysM peptidoglycan-binding domain-containing protein [Nitratireductor sp. CAU 1489]|uniref:LysM peptidoglycan-binding domain-containing protein n=1 Tax=Nitratireductor arenosus TaxID=2682096 RepID=A0A844QNL5_9HYPH|nr:LysM peptidoglycan-binding domain-containing protein [Nitratireductor arenosus]MVA99648.1 LysM peptidoglycan-binding domain-containing protein [Nitratireductor arenosus]
MVISPLKALLFLAGGSAAAVSAAYVSGAFDGMLKEPPAMVAALPEDGAAIRADRNTDRATSDKDGPSVGPVNQDDTQGAEKKDILPPSFDLVRVEPDGSVVLAGKAAPNASVEIITGTRVIAKATATPEGDFAVILDDPLEPGNYQIVLRSTTPDNVVATSVETAVVAVPETESGQVLALVEEPGKPSKLITLPEVAAVEDDAAAADVANSGTIVEDPKEDAEETASDQPASKAQVDAPVDTVARDLPETAEARAAPVDTAARDLPDTRPVDPADKADRSEEAGDDPVGIAAAEPGPAAPEGSDASEAVVAPRPEEPQPDKASKPAEKASPRVRVEAVEIEGRQVFVAGTGASGMTVRVYANAILLGEAQVAASGRFLIETERDLPVGDYIVRADLLDDGGRKVVARAAVPFQREPGETVAAVAPPPSAPEGTVETVRAEEAPAEEMSADLPAKRPQVSAETTPPAAGETGRDQAGDSGEAVVAARAEPAATAVAEVLAPKLQSVQSAVIIRRGDTLWRISRRVYGRGVRYSTIYLANEDQIEDPDRIWPGQVFRVPDTSDDGEEADMRALEDQMTTIGAASEATTAVE